MSIDYTVRFGERKPTLIDIVRVVEDFLGESRVAFGELRCNATAISVNLLDRTTNPLLRVVEDRLRDKWLERERAKGPTKRGFEIFSFDADTKAIVFALHGQDAFVHTVVEGICKVIAHYWNGELELPS